MRTSAILLSAAALAAGPAALSSVAWGSGTGPAEASTTIQIQEHVVEVSGRLGLGYLSGEVKEVVYDPASGARISELTWQLEDIYMLNAGISITPAHWLKINGDLWIKVNEGDGHMDDYDYLLPGYDWTHWSHHEDTDLNEGYILDINAEFPFYRHNATVFSALVGYKRDSWEWESRGGDFVYSTYALRDTVGSFPPGEPAITYRQWYDVPYIGLAFASRLNNISFMGRFIGTTFAYANDEDTHHMRDLLFEEDFDPTSMWSFDLGGSYHFTPQLSLLALFHYQQYEEAKGSTTITDQLTGERITIHGDAAGTDHTSSLFSLSLEYRF